MGISDAVFFPLQCGVFDRLSGTPPFHSRDEDKLYEIIKAANLNDSMSENPVWKSISKEGESILSTNQRRLKF